MGVALGVRDAVDEQPRPAKPARASDSSVRGRRSSIRAGTVVTP
jgi:hypothetical protein